MVPDLQYALDTCEHYSKHDINTDVEPAIAATIRQSHRLAAKILSRVQAIPEDERSEILADLARVDALTLLGMRRHSRRPNASLSFESAFVSDKAGHEFWIVSQPQQNFRPLRLVVDPTIADHYNVVHVAVGAEVIFRGPASGRMFPPLEPGEGTWPYENLDSKRTVPPGYSVTIQVISLCQAEAFKATIWGTEVRATS